MVETFGVKRTVDHLTAIGQRAMTPSLFAGRALELLTESEREWWGEEPWRPLMHSTEKRKAREHKDPRTLRVTGLLEHALTVPGAEGQKWEAESDSGSWWRFGIDKTGPAYYGIFHQLGDGVPRREVVHATPRLAKTMRREWVRWIAKGD